MRTLWESGLDRVWQGMTSLDEVVRVLGERSQEDEDESAAAASAAASASAAAGSPQAASPVPASVRSAVASEHSGKPRILIADDDPQMRRLVRSILERDGYDVTEAGDGLDAIDQIESKQFDLMVYPNRSHCICEGRGTSLSVYSLLTRYLLTHLEAGAR